MQLTFCHLKESYQSKCLARLNDPITSKQAARRIVLSGKAGTDEAKVFEALKAYPCSTDKELAIKSGLPYEMIHKRRSGLVRKGFVRSTGQVRDRQQVWEVLA